MTNKLRNINGIKVKTKQFSNPLKRSEIKLPLNNIQPQNFEHKQFRNSPLRKSLKVIQPKRKNRNKIEELTSNTSSKSKFGHYFSKNIHEDFSNLSTLKPNEVNK
jgi:hypothetical protein